jgi:signal transduction histidine kinase
MRSTRLELLVRHLKVRLGAEEQYLVDCILEKKAQLRCEELPVVQGNSIQLKQIFQNLLENALRYTGPEAPEIEIGAEVRGHHWLIRVQDNGRGFAPSQAAYIFEPLTRLQAGQDMEAEWA